MLLWDLGGEPHHTGLRRHPAPLMGFCSAELHHGLIIKDLVYKWRCLGKVEEQTFSPQLTRACSCLWREWVHWLELPASAVQTCVPRHLKVFSTQLVFGKRNIPNVFREVIVPGPPLRRMFLAYLTGINMLAQGRSPQCSVTGPFSPSLHSTWVSIF